MFLREAFRVLRRGPNRSYRAFLQEMLGEGFEFPVTPLVVIPLVQREPVAIPGFGSKFPTYRLALVGKDGDVDVHLVIRNGYFAKVDDKLTYGGYYLKPGVILTLGARRFYYHGISAPEGWFGVKAS